MLHIVADNAIYRRLQRLGRYPISSDIIIHNNIHNTVTRIYVSLL